MGILIGAEGVRQEWPGKLALAGATVGVYEGDRIGVVGRNGDGKTTLLDILAQRVQPDEGSVTWRNNIHVGVLGQADDLSDDATVHHSVVGDGPDYEWAARARTRQIIDALLEDIPWEGRVGELSGGQRRRVDLARLLVEDWDVLLLDEPTNHLDMGAITWLAQHCKRRWPAGEGGLVVVTHDRWFLDEVCTSMWEVHDGRVDPFEGGFSAYVQQRVERERQAQVAEARRQTMLRRELAWLSRGAQARSTKPKFRVAEAQALVADVPELRNELELKRMAVSRLGKQVIELRRVGFAYPGGSDVVDVPEWIIGPGDRFGILGENGAGKSTLLGLMQGKLAPTRGHVKIGKTVKFGLLSQDLTVLRAHERYSVQELLNSVKRSVVVDGKETTPAKLLERLGFDKRELLTRVCDLSGGQRRRLAILCVLLDEPNVLVLDEPGNDLDTDMLAVLEDLLDTWPGTLLLVTHDRYLMERVTDHQFALLDGHVRHVPGGVDEYLRLVGELRARRAPSAGPAVGAPAKQAAEEPDDAKPQLSNQERRELKKRFDAVERRLDKVAAAPDEIRAQMAAANPSDFAALTELQGKLDAALAEQEALEDEWLELSERLGIDA